MDRAPSYLVCACGRFMHTEGVDERHDEAEGLWMVQFECRSCRRSIGLVAPPDQAAPFVDRLLWSDAARHRLDRMPPYVEVVLKPDVEAYARSTGARVVTLSLFEHARHGGTVSWAPEAERRLANVPAGVRALARIELERTACSRGQAEVTVALMEEVKARYFGMGARS